MADSIGAVIIDVKSDISHLVQGMQKAEGVVEQSTKIMTNAVGVLATAYSAISLKQFIDETVQATNEQKAFAEQLAISVETLTKWEYIASKAHVSTDQLRDSFKDAGTKVTEFQRDGESAKEAFKALGISQDFAKEKMYTTERSMEILLKRLEKFPDGMQKATIAQEIFGDEGASVIRVANLGAEAIEKYTQQAIKGNIATSEAFAQKSATYADAQKTLSALEGGWASAVIEESHFLEMGTNMYSLLSDSVMNWTADVQSGNSTFVDGLNSISTGVDAVFPTVVEIVGITASSFGTMGNAVIDVSGVVGDLVGDLVGFDNEANTNITTLGHFAGLAMGATMALENFSNLVKFSSNGFEYFGASISTYAISRLDYLQSKFYASMATISDFFSFIDDDYASSAHEYEQKSIKLEASMHQALADGNAKFAKLGKERGNIIAKMHSAELIQAKMEETAYKVSVRQREAFVKNTKKLKMPDYDKQGKESVKQLTKSIKALKDAEDAEKNKKSSLSKSSLAHTKALKSEATAYKNLKNGVKDYSNELKSFEDEYNQTTMDKFDYKILKLDEEKKHYTEIGAEKIKVEKWYSVEYAKIEAERQKSIADSTEKANRVVEEQRKKIADAKEQELKEFEDAQAQKQKVLEDFSDKLQKLTLSDFEYSKIQLGKEKKEWIENGIEKIEAEKLYAIEYKNILEEKEKLEKEVSDKIAQENAKAWEDANAKQKEAFEAYQEEQKKKIEGEVAYQDLLGNFDYGDQLEYEKKSLWYKERGKDVSVEQIKALEKQRDITEEIGRIRESFKNMAIEQGQNVLNTYSQTGDIQASFDSIDSNAVNSAMMNSGNMYLQMGAVAGQVIGGALSEPMSDFAKSEADIYASVSTLNDNAQILNDVMHPHLEYTKQSAEHLQAIQNSLVGIGNQAIFGGNQFSTGQDFTDKHYYHTDSLERNSGIDMDNIHDFISTLDPSTLLTRILGDVFNTGSNEFVDDVSSSLVRSIVGDTDVKLKDAGVMAIAQSYADIVEGGLDLMSYQVIETSKTYLKFISSSSTKDKFQDIEGGIEDNVNSIFAEIFTSSFDTGAKLGVDSSDIAEAMSGYISEEMKQSFKEKNADEIAEYFSGYFGNETNKIAEILADAGGINLENFRVKGEELGTTWQRLGVQLEQTNYEVERLGFSALKFGNIASSIDFSRLSVSTKAYTDNFYTEKEQLELAFGDLESVFGSMEQSVPLSVEEYRKQVEAIDLTTTEGKKLYALYMDNAGATNTYVNALNAQKQAFSEINSNLKNVGLSFVDFNNITSQTSFDFLSTDISTYISKFKTEAEQAKIAEGKLIEVFEAVNLSIPETVEEMNNLVDGLDQSNPLWEEQYSVIMENAGAVDNYIGSLNAQADALYNATHALDSSIASIADYQAKIGMNDLQSLQYDKGQLVESLGLDGVTIDNFGDMWNDRIDGGWMDTGGNPIITPPTDLEIEQGRDLVQILIEEDKKIRSIEEQRAKDSVSRASSTAKEIKEIETFNQSNRLDSYKKFYETFNLNDEEKLLYDVKKANIAYAESLKESGLESITGAEYIERYTETLKNGATEHQVDVLDRLGDSLQNVAETQKAYGDLLAEQEKQMQEINANKRNFFIEQQRELQKLGEESASKYSDLATVVPVTLSEDINSASVAMQSLGLESVTAETFTSQYQDAVADGVSKDDIKIWEQLGDALQHAKEQGSQYAKDLERSLNTGTYDPTDPASVANWWKSQEQYMGEIELLQHQMANSDYYAGWDELARATRAINGDEQLFDIGLPVDITQEAYRTLVDNFKANQQAIDGEQSRLQKLINEAKGDARLSTNDALGITIDSIVAEFETIAEKMDALNNINVDFLGIDDKQLEDLRERELALGQAKTDYYIDLEQQRVDALQAELEQAHSADNVAQEIENIYYEAIRRGREITEADQSRIDSLTDLYKKLEDIEKKEQEIADMRLDFTNRIKDDLFSFQDGLFSLNNDADNITKALNLINRETDKFAESVGAIEGIGDVNISNFADLYADATADIDSITSEQIDNWGAIGDALLGVAKAQKAYDDILKKNLEHLTEKSDSFTEYFTTYGMSSEEKTFYDLDKNMGILSKSLEDLGIESISTKEYLEQYARAVGDGAISNEQIELWDSLGDAMRGATEAQKAYIDSLKAQQTEIRGTMESLIRGEVDRIRSDYDSRVSALDSLRTNAEKYQTPKTVYSIDIYDAIGNWDSSEDNAKIESMIGSWRDAQIKAGEERIKQLNEEINLSNQLRESIISMQDGAYKSFNSFYTDIGKSASSTIDQLLKDENYREVGSVFSSYATQQKEEVGGMEAFLNIAKMNQKISAIDAPDERKTVEFDVSAIDETTSKMLNSLIETNEKNLPDVDASIKELWTQNAQYFDATTPFALYMQEGARDATYQEKMLEQKQLWETLGLDQKIRDERLAMVQQQFTERYDLKESINQAMLDRNFSAQNVISQRFGIDIKDNSTQIKDLEKKLNDLIAEQKEQNRLQAEQNAIAREQLASAQQTERNTEESIING